MIYRLNQQATKFAWIGTSPNSNNKVALLVPQYNESSHCDLLKRLEYFHDVHLKLKHSLDVILIDDGSTDGSLDKIREFRDKQGESFYLASVTPNANKVGSLFLTVLAIEHDLIILSDFDSNLHGLESLIENSKTFLTDKSIIGGYFRMLPHEGQGEIFEFQKLEYALARCLYKFHEKERSVPVMPGAGCFYKRSLLLDIYNSHSGLRNGEDREATLLGLKFGYKMVYLNQILTLTKPPSTFRELVKQRVRWNLGYLETIQKEKKFYFQEISKFSRIGVRTLFDITVVLSILIIPAIILLFSYVFFLRILIFLVAYYFICMAWCFVLLNNSREEAREFENRKIKSVILYPLNKVCLDSLAWSKAVFSFIRNYRANKLINKN